MKIHINGKQEELAASLTVQELLVYRNVASPNMVSVELNGNILKREEFDTERIKDGDAVEFLYFMGGGSGQ